MYRAITRNIQVTATPRYVAERSEPEQGRYFWAYTIEVANLGTETVQLKARHWIITDANNEVQEVRGLGVVGQQPLLKPGESFEYTSGCTLQTPVGTMKGSYQMLGEDGSRFDAEIPEFVLAIPRVLH